MFDRALLLDEDSAGRRHAIRPAEVEHPAHHVEHVDAHIADDAVAVFVERAPPASVRQRVALRVRVRRRVVWPQRRGAGPGLIVEVLRRLRYRRVQVRAHVVVAVHLGHADLAEQAGLRDLLARFHQVRRAAPLRADLHDALVLACRVEHRLAFHHIDADRLLHVDVRAGFHAPRSSAARASGPALRPRRCRGLSPSSISW